METPDELRERMSRAGKGRLRTMTAAKRVALAYQAGVQGGAPRKIDHERVLKLRERGLKWREIAERMGISMASVARIMKERK